MNAPTRNGDHHILSRQVSSGRSKLLRIDGRRTIQECSSSFISILEDSAGSRISTLVLVSRVIVSCHLVSGGVSVISQDGWISGFANISFWARSNKENGGFV